MSTPPINPNGGSQNSQYFPPEVAQSREISQPASPLAGRVFAIIPPDPHGFEPAIGEVIIPPQAPTHSRVLVPVVPGSIPMSSRRLFN